VAKAIFGLDSAAKGTVELNGKPLALGSTKVSMAAGVGLVPEDRKRQGLVLELPIRANVSLAIWILRGAIGILSARKKRRFQSVFWQAAGKGLFDGSPAKLARETSRKLSLPNGSRAAKAPIVDEPTRGVDVGAKAAIHALIDNLSQGLAVILISSELPEVLNLSTRILVMRDARCRELPAR
jgi:ABC-type sugar transport system ATPase subunit